MWGGSGARSPTQSRLFPRASRRPAARSGGRGACGTLPLWIALLGGACNAYDPGLLPQSRNRPSGVSGVDDRDGGPGSAPDADDMDQECVEMDDPACPRLCREACNGFDDDCDGRTDENDDGSLCQLPFAATVCALAGSGEDVKPTCLIAACLEQHVDCNERVEDGCESTLDSAEQCGVCGRRCELPNAEARCGEGSCEIARCEDGFEDCDGKPENGCEQALDELGACGGCGRNCGAERAQTECDEGQCRFTRCEDGFGDCNRDAAKLDAGDGCETNLTTPQNCGACGRVCPSDRPFCSGGRCSSIECPTATADCDGDNETCEASLRANDNCGSCGARCGPFANADVSCGSGRCTPSCRDNFADCDRNRQNGCETDLRSTTSCGRCGVSCDFPNASTNCSDGACQLAGCLSGFGDCNNDLNRDGCEARLNTVRDCGACGRGCVLANASETCSSGTCQISSCSSGFANCDGQSANGCEIDLNGDARNCGSCGNVCPNGLSCRGARCVCTSDADCAFGQSCCNGSCIDTRSNPSHCGGCGVVCASGSTCCSRACRNTSDDVNNCGGCGRTCGDQTDRCDRGRCRCGSTPECNVLEVCCGDRGCQLGLFCL